MGPAESPSRDCLGSGGVKINRILHFSGVWRSQTSFPFSPGYQAVGICLPGLIYGTSEMTP